MRSPQIDRSLQANLFLLLLSDEKEPDARLRVARALGKLRDRSCLPQLKEAMKHEQDTEVLGAIRDAIAKLKV